MNDKLPTIVPMNAIVLENARVCNLRCAACPTTHAVGYPAGFMTMATFRRILEHIDRSVFPQCGLTGWGETFLDPNYFAKLRLLKNRGYYVGCTSNAILLDRQRVERLLVEGLDLLGLSVDLFHLRAGGKTSAEMAKHLRTALQPLHEQSTGLTVGLNVVVPLSGRDFLFELLERVEELPLSQVSVIPLIMMPTRELHGELMSAAEISELQQRCIARWPRRRIAFAYLEPPPAGNCRSDVHRNVYVSYDGEVSPCCTLALEFPNFCFSGMAHRTAILSFGNLAEQPFLEIWESPDYAAFRRRFQNGSVPEVCGCCNAWRLLPEEVNRDAH